MTTQKTIATAALVPTLLVCGIGAAEANFYPNYSMGMMTVQYPIEQQVGQLQRQLEHQQWMQQQLAQRLQQQLAGQQLQQQQPDHINLERKQTFEVTTKLDSRTGRVVSRVDVKDRIKGKETFRNGNRTTHHNIDEEQADHRTMVQTMNVGYRY